MAGGSNAKSQQVALQPATSDRIKAMIDAGKAELARRAIEEHLAIQPHDLNVQLLRRQLGTLYLRTGRRVDGEAQFERMLRYIYKNPEHAQEIIGF